MNIHKRFWPVDNTDVNRMFSGYDKGETTQRIAADIFEAVSGYDYGIQLARFLPARKLTRSNQRPSRRARFPTCAASMRAGCSSRSLGPKTASYEGRHPRDARSRSRGARQAWAQRERQRERIKQKRLIPHSTPHSRRLLSRKRRPRRGRQRRPPPTARPRRCGPGAGCEGSPQEAAASQSRRQWRHLGGR